ncbi:tetratricopeptide repeat-containing protein [Cystoisospora suis]|uniref:Tetratricopeptide repeat-containing protein n=1 Tax=Cystoisospora suis TaxID=483139 RepID=A0A2C6KP58_9APIC|nr:tetratricopeptide repeat-containing protein [Cystoisospora suis]
MATAVSGESLSATSGGAESALALLNRLKQDGNAAFKRGDYKGADDIYSRCLVEAREGAGPGVHTVVQDAALRAAVGSAGLTSSELGRDSKIAHPDVARGSPLPAPDTDKFAAEAVLGGQEVLHAGWLALEAQTLCNRALCRQMRGQFQEAESDCTAAIQLQPNYVKAYYRRARALHAQKKLAQCVEDLQVCLRFEPGNKEAELMLASVRDEVMKEEDTRMQEQLPDHLLNVGLDSNSPAASRVRALRQLGAFVQERKLQRLFLKEGGLRLVAVLLRDMKHGGKRGTVLTEKTSPSTEFTDISSDTSAGRRGDGGKHGGRNSNASVAVEASCWELLLSVVQQGREDPADDEYRKSAALSSSMDALNEPVQIDCSIVECRRALGDLWSSTDFLVRVRQLRRAGIASTPEVSQGGGVSKSGDLNSAEDSDECEAGKRRAAWRGEACEYLLRAMGCVAQLRADTFETDPAFLEACSEGLQCSDNVGVQRAAVSALVGVADARRRMGLRSKPLALRHGVEKCLEDALQAIADVEMSLASTELPDIKMRNRRCCQLDVTTPGEEAPSQKNSAQQEDKLQLLARDHDQARVGEAARRLEIQTEFLLITLLSLLADKERAKGDDPPDLNRLLDQLLAPYFKPSNDPEESLVYLTVGLRGLRLALTASRDVARAYLAGASSILPYVLAAAAGRNSEMMSASVVGTRAQRRQQEAAVEVLLPCLDFPELRAKLLEVNAVPVLAKICTEQDGRSSGLECRMRARLAAALARLSVHDTDVRIQVFDCVDFYGVLHQLLKEILSDGDDRREDRGENNGEKGKREKSVGVGEDTLRALLEIFFFLSLHADFKGKLVTDEQKGPTLLRRLLEVCSVRTHQNQRSGAAGNPASSLTRYLLVQSLCNIMRSRDDKDKKRRRKGEVNGPFADIDDEQMKELEELFKRLPAGARPAANGEIDLGDRELAFKLRDSLVNLHVVSVIVQSVCTSPPPSINVFCAAAQALKFLCVDPSHRGAIVLEGGVRALLTTVEALKDYPDDRRDAQQAAAQLSISVNPTLFSYREALDLVPCIMPLLKDNHELLQYEAALALTNLTSLSDEVRVRAWLGDCWGGFEDLIFSENDLLRAAGLEGWCNLAVAETVQNSFGEKAEKYAKANQELQDLKLMLAFAAETNNTRAQEAAVAALAMLAQDKRVAQRLPSYEFFPNLTTCLDSVSEKNEALIVRLVAALYNVWQGLVLMEEEGQDDKQEEKRRLEAAIRRNANKLKGQTKEMASQMVKELK